MLCPVERNDMFRIYSEIKFSYKDCDVTITRLNNLIDVGFVKIHKEGYIIEKHSEQILVSNYKHLLEFLNDQTQADLLEETYKKIIMGEKYINGLLKPQQNKNENNLKNN